MSVLHSPRLVPCSSSEGNHYRSPYVFRGMDDATWSLQTSLQRLAKEPTTDRKKIERSLIRSFRKYASAGAFDDKSEWYVLAVAQHNGLPTRVLDWTASPLVGAHFSCGDETHKKAKGALWCLHVDLLREINEQKIREINEQKKSAAASLRGIAWVYDTRLLEDRFAGLDELDASRPDGPLMLLWEPPSLDSRIANQHGLLSLMNHPEESHTAFLEEQCRAYPELLLRVVIDAEAKSEIRDMLDQNGISERTLFPGLPGLCDWLKRYYGNAW